MGFQVAIIDRGVDFSHPRLHACRYYCVEIAGEGSMEVHRDHSDETGHGTAIAGIIHKIVPQVQLISVKLEANQDLISESQLIQAINWCTEQPEIRVINISLGIATKAPSNELFAACETAYRRNKFIVSAVHNFPYLECYPAHFKCVIGVGCGLVRNKKHYGYVGQGPTNVLAKGTVQRVLWKDHGFMLTSGTSYATPHFTGVLSEMLLHNEQAQSFGEVESLVIRNAQEYVQELNYIRKSERRAVSQQNDLSEEHGALLFRNEKQYEHVSKLAVFPCCEKEMRSLLELKTELIVGVELLIDYPRAYSKGSFDPITEQAIRRDLTRADLDKFDTLVVGYFLDQPFDANIMYGFHLIRTCIEADKNFIVWDYNVYNYIKTQLKEFKDFRGKVIFNYVDDSRYFDIMNYRYLSDVPVPVIAVAGTGSRQGKVTTQIKIRKILQQAGYKSSLLSTEPQGGLLGGDFSFPYGHNSTVYLDLNRWDEFLQYSLKGIFHYNSPDVIITGTQGGTIPQNPGVLLNFDASMLRSLQFLIGVQADALVLTVNASDKIAFIRQTLQVIAAFCSAKLLFIAMSPWALDSGNPTLRNRLPKPEYHSRMNEVAQAIGVPVLDIFDEQNDNQVMASIYEAFSYENSNM